MGTTDGIYGSGNKSAINHTSADRRGRVGEPLRANPTHNPSPRNQSTDKYYGNQAGARPAMSSAVATPAAPAALAVPEIVDGVAKLLLKSETDVNKIRDQAIAALISDARVIVMVDSDDRDSLERLLRTQMDLAVARERITSGQYREMFYNAGVEMTDAATLIDEIPEADEEDMMARDIPDFDAFVKGTDVGDPGGDQTVVHPPVPANRVDVGHLVLDDDTTPGQPDLKLNQMSSKTLPDLVGLDVEEEHQRMLEESEHQEELQRRFEEERAVVATQGEEDEPDEEFDEEPTVKPPPRRAARKLV